jgi:hypothetical protein
VISHLIAALVGAVVTLPAAVALIRVRDQREDAARPEPEPTLHVVLVPFGATPPTPREIPAVDVTVISQSRGATS